MHCKGHCHELQQLSILLKLSLIATSDERDGDFTEKEENSRATTKLKPNNHQKTGNSLVSEH